MAVRIVRGRLPARLALSHSVRARSLVKGRCDNGHTTRLYSVAASTSDSDSLRDFRGPRFDPGYDLLSLKVLCGGRTCLRTFSHSLPSLRSMISVVESRNISPLTISHQAISPMQLQPRWPWPAGLQFGSSQALPKSELHSSYHSYSKSSSKIDLLSSSYLRHPCGLSDQYQKPGSLAIQIVYQTCFTSPYGYSIRLPSCYVVHLANTQSDVFLLLLDNAGQLTPRLGHYIGQYLLQEA